MNNYYLMLTLLAAASAMTGTLDAAPFDVFRPYVSAAVVYDDNLFRVSDDEEALAQLGTTKKSDTIRTAGAGFDVDVPVSRQRFVLQANADRNYYKHFSKLDHTAGKGKADWHWRAGNQWDGLLRYVYVRKLADFTEQRIRTKDMITRQRAEARASYQFHPRWQLTGSGGWTESDHDEELRERLDRTKVFGELQLDYVSRAHNRVGTWVRVIDADFPNRELDPDAPVPVDNSFRDTILGMAVRWQATGHSILKGRAGYQQRDYDQVSDRDFNGWTGRLTYNWLVSDKTEVEISLWRDLDAVQEDIASFVDERGVGAKVTWSPTEKLTLEGGGRYEKRDHDGNPGLTVTNRNARKDDVYAGEASIAYEPLRNVRLSLGGRAGQRDSNRPNSEYDFWRVNATVRVGF